MAPDLDTARDRVREAWDSGAAWEVLERWLAAQGGRIATEREDFGLETADLATEVVAHCDGWLAGTDCRELGLALADLGGARRKVEDPLDLSCGIDFLPMVGDRISKGDVLARVSCDRRAEAEEAARLIAAALEISAEAVPANDLILDRVE